MSTTMTTFIFIFQYNLNVYILDFIATNGEGSFFNGDTGIRGLMRGMATLPKVTRSY